MPKKTIGIYSGELYVPKNLYHKWDETNLENGGIGGSEVWVIELSKIFNNLGYKVIVFADCETWHFTKEGIEYIPINKFNTVCIYQYFDYFISSRRVDEINEKLNAGQILIMAHDCMLLNCNTYDDIHMAKIKRIAYQCEFQKEMLIQKYSGLNDSNFFKTHQAIDYSLYENKNIVKKNKMVWSTHKVRGARFLIEKIFPLIKKEVPDFEIDICGYANDMTDDYFIKDGINIIGNVTKEELIRRQLESKIWIYPNIGIYEDGRLMEETFCITAIENAAAKNALLVANKTCFSDTLKGYDGFIGTELFNNNENDYVLPNSNYDDFVLKFAEKAILILNNNEEYMKLANQAYEICKRYTWENVANTFIKEFNNNSITPIKRMPSNRLILLTGLFRVENFDKIFDSIKHTLEIDESLKLTWVICYDKFHVTQDIGFIPDVLSEFAKTHETFGWLLSPSGKYKDKPNYGGDLFNDTLEWLYNNWYTNEDFWVYILDDDNTITENMASLLNKSLKNANDDNKSIIYYNMLYENGVLSPFCETTFEINRLLSKQPLYNPYYNITDPSQLIIKISELKTLNYYANGIDYDKVLHNYLLNNNIKILFTETLLNNSYLNKYQTTHNGITNKKIIHEIIEKLDNDECCNCTININFNDIGNTSININKKIANNILKSLNNDK